MDLEQGKLERLTYRTIKSYEVDGFKIKSDNDIQAVQRQLVNSGHLTQSGRMFISNFDLQLAS